MNKYHETSTLLHFIAHFSRIYAFCAWSRPNTHKNSVKLKIVSFFCNFKCFLHIFSVDYEDLMSCSSIIRISYPRQYISFPVSCHKCFSLNIRKHTINQLMPRCKDQHTRMTSLPPWSKQFMWTRPALILLLLRIIVIQQKHFVFHKCNKGTKFFSQPNN
jgi:hypothetical protein